MDMSFGLSGKSGSLGIDPLEPKGDFRGFVKENTLLFGRFPQENSYGNIDQVSKIEKG